MVVSIVVALRAHLPALLPTLLTTLRRTTDPLAALPIMAAALVATRMVTLAVLLRLLGLAPPGTTLPLALATLSRPAAIGVPNPLASSHPVPEYIRPIVLEKRLL